MSGLERDWPYPEYKVFWDDLAELNPWKEGFTGSLPIEVIILSYRTFKYICFATELALLN